ncbi:hypothetical protein CGRA01v4_12277 [Colletotrichum graminicola]|nr:hypothetical protein CGRA01v4_12277 [Colletotrichum graminicola]
MGSDPATEVHCTGYWGREAARRETRTWSGIGYTGTQQEHGGLHIALYPSFCFFGTGFGGSTGFSVCYIWDSLLIIIILLTLLNLLYWPCDCNVDVTKPQLRRFHMISHVLTRYSNADM